MVGFKKEDYLRGREYAIITAPLMKRNKYFRRYDYV